MRYFIIAGEASGDLHGSHLINALKAGDPGARVACWGGDKMQAAGAELLKHYKDLAFMGFIEVLRHLPEILKNLHSCKAQVLAFKPDVLVLIDYPGFNLRIAEWASRRNIKVVYYISPQIWAWKASRINIIRKHVDKMLVILPFEQAFYARHGLRVEFVGHPLTGYVKSALEYPPVSLSDKPIVALLPGSRKQEIRLKLPVMLEAVARFPDYQAIVAAAPGINPAYYREMLAGTNAVLLENDTYNLLKQAKAALVTSGTATLETALFGIPQVVCYKGNVLSYWLARRLIRVKYISLVNLILDAPAVRELIQFDFTAPAVAAALKDLLTDTELQERLQQDYTRLWELLWAEAPPAHTAAAAIAGLASGEDPPNRPV